MHMAKKTNDLLKKGYGSLGNLSNLFKLVPLLYIVKKNHAVHIYPLAEPNNAVHYREPNIK